MTRFLIFLPVRNGGDYVRRAIQSVLHQTNTQWHLVVLENGSTDGTPALLEQFRSDRVIIVPAAEPLDIFGNWHRAIDYLRQNCSGDEFVTFLGHDDLLYPNFLQDIADLIQREPNATLYQTMFDLIDGDGTIIRPCRPIPAYEEWQDLLAALCWSLRDSYGTGYVTRAADYCAVGGIPNLPHLLYSDHLLFTRLASLGHKASTRSISFAYRLHCGSTSGVRNAAKFAAEVSALKGFVAAISQEFPEFTEQRFGRTALASAIAKGTFAARTPAVFRGIPAHAQSAVRELAGIFAELADGLSLDELTGPPVSASGAVNLLRRINLTKVIWIGRLRAQLAR